ncbi:CoA-dependent acyltransferase [Cutaneotrichosporon oleaginosum]|uniref:Dihydrolipoamide acetyltransferase component of pyruvate dehydrogenase complex n=1 Tax=Cutaneotrichosporon oleaginosum TaxID=879819 RepID=A0A0J1B2D7_9TREE|nr:CoA-dependent acyltransferase [Cutaneotrichosporon oleaginosum]KLT41769.1 CoA-dependent acyltransferase [Cutaneotrichosporon oleaginosum]TXT12365.1 hypothetical protein COLE_02775 [Cutaneotrichosporon oleaginosum]
MQAVLRSPHRPHRPRRPLTSMSRIATRLLSVAPRARVHACPLLRAPWTGVTPASSLSSLSSPVRSSPVPQPPASQKRAFNASARTHVPFQFKLADIGEGITQVEVIKWNVELGQDVEEFDPLCEVQSDKAVVEITAPYAGKVTKLGPPAGSIAKVGSTLCVLDTTEDHGQEQEEMHEEAEEAHEEPEPTPAPVQSQAPPPPKPQAAQTESNSATPKFAPKPHPLSDTAVRFEGEASVLPQAPKPVYDIPDHVEARQDGSLSRGRIVRTSPAVRAHAGRLGVVLEHVTPSGPGGRVTKEDVERYAASSSSSSSAITPAPKASVPAPRAPKAASPAPSAVSADRGEATERMEMGRTRKVMYRAMGSMGDVPHFGYHHTLDLTNLLPLMKAANAKVPETKGYLAADVPSSFVNAPPLPERQKTSVLAFLVKALALALEEHPIMRSRVKEADEQRWLEVSRDANIGIAVSDPKLGLLTPALSGLDPAAPISAVNAALNDLRARAARPGPLPHITISSVGPLGESRSANPVLPPGGGLAIAAVGRAAWEIEWVLRNGNGPSPSSVWNLEPTQVEGAGTRAVLKCPVSWSGDHRVLEGAELIAFTETWKRYVEQPWLWLQV